MTYHIKRTIDNTYLDSVFIPTDYEGRKIHDTFESAEFAFKSFGLTYDSYVIERNTIDVMRSELNKLDVNTIEWQLLVESMPKRRYRG